MGLLCLGNCPLNAVTTNANVVGGELDITIEFSIIEVITLTLNWIVYIHSKDNPNIFLPNHAIPLELDKLDQDLNDFEVANNDDDDFFSMHNKKVQKRRLKHLKSL